MMSNQSIKTTKVKKLQLNKATKRKVAAKKALVVVGIILRAFILIGLCFVILLPLFEKLTLAVRSPSSVNDQTIIFIPKELSSLNFEIAGTILIYWKSLFNSFLISAVTTIIQVIATAVAGYAFARLKFKGSNIIFFLILITLIVPNEALDRSRSWILKEYPFFGISLIGKSFAMFIMAAFGQGIRSAIFIYLFRQTFRGIPKELEESAQVDGCGVFRTFWSVMLPNARGAIVTVSLFAFVWQWNDCYFGKLLGYTSDKFSLLAVKLSTGMEGLPTVIGTYVAAGKLPMLSQDITTDPAFYSLIANTAALMIMAPLLIAYFFVQRLFVESIERTGITG